MTRQRKPPKAIVVCGVMLKLRLDAPIYYATYALDADPRPAPRIEVWQAHGRWNALLYGQELHLSARHKPTRDEAVEALEARVLKATMDVVWLERGGE